mmetsp:Transcript_13788/g.17995  ORF Transcript_13788/g.17995 Transcript_13788/m.17995 type:complete len:91 (-) Transcript_13788:222-494(-)|eukprot:CAMPEP_0198136672 /NCGR_PEP_ID=MMETSP1443-20131203/302_1 /TAXON_ID=186043 /ORGANISM="Entomoneis sp., Strain CCMP2396" /LENGTH=90 /DNA_ID=CAMNT_0043797929 /DNA_START=82 /DNA_END=354 /DNA_ORIENTATION=-
MFNLFPTKMSASAGRAVHSDESSKMGPVTQEFTKNHLFLGQQPQQQQPNQFSSSSSSDMDVFNSTVLHRNDSNASADAYSNFAVYNDQFL